MENVCRHHTEHTVHQLITCDIHLRAAGRRSLYAPVRGEHATTCGERATAVAHTLQHRKGRTEEKCSNAKGYAEKYRVDGRPVTKVGLSFSSTDRNITEWIAEGL